MSAPAPPLLLYDGDCAFCTSSVRFVLRHDTRRRSARFAARGGRAGRAILARNPAAAAADSLVWVVDDGAVTRVLLRSDAALAIARYLGGGWGVLGILGRVVPRPIRDSAYDLVARYRHRLGGSTSCEVPRPEDRVRMLD